MVLPAALGMNALVEGLDRRPIAISKKSLSDAASSRSRVTSVNRIKAFRKTQIISIALAVLCL